MAASYLIIQKA